MIPTGASGDSLTHPESDAGETARVAEQMGRISRAAARQGGHIESGYTPPRPDYLREDARARWQQARTLLDEVEERRADEWVRYTRERANHLLMTMLGFTVLDADWEWEGDLNRAELTIVIDGVRLQAQVHARVWRAPFADQPDALYAVLECPDPVPLTDPHTHHWPLTGVAELGRLLTTGPTHQQWASENWRPPSQGTVPEVPTAAQAMVDAIRLLIHEEIDAP